MPQEVNTRKLYDLCRMHQGKHPGLLIYPLEDDQYNHQHTPWHSAGFVVYLDDYCWEVKRVRKYKDGQPDGFDYHFVIQSGLEVNLAQAIELLQQQLKSDSK